ncbi:MAG: hypothetical protein PVF85_09995 [Anaerolineales bacterium]|jgi:hypothetical protein
MAPRPISVEFYTTSHRILGRLSPTGTGLFSHINDPTSSFVEIEGAHLMRLHQPGRLVARYPILWLVKSEIVAGLLSNRSELGPTGYARGGYTTSVPHWIRVVMGGYELKGIVETPGKFNFGALMFETDRFFMPIYNATLTAILFPNVKGASEAMIFNRSMVDALALLPKDEIPSTSPEE